MFLRENHYFYHANEPFSPDFSIHLYHMLRSAMPFHSPILFLCIGSDRVTGDCLGPLTGYKLKERSSRLPVPYAVYGTLSSPVHAQNIEAVLSEIRLRFQNPLIIAIDASIGDPEEVGTVTLSNAPLYPGLGLGKKIMPAGEISITGIVSSYERNSIMHLQQIRLNRIMQLADWIVRGISDSLLLYT